MKKNFTVSVPDELYVSANTLGKTLSLSYDGPSTIDAIVSRDGRFEGTVPFSEYEPSGTDQIVTVYANTDPAVAYLILPAPAPEYTFEEQEMEDGNVWLNNTNPRLHDYYDIIYNTEANEWNLQPRVKDPRTPGLMEATHRKTRLNNSVLIHGMVDDGSNTDIVQALTTRFAVKVQDMTADEVVAIVNEYVDTLDTFIEQEQPKLAWKYEIFQSVPDAPEILQPVFEE